MSSGKFTLQDLDKTANNPNSSYKAILSREEIRRDIEKLNFFVQVEGNDGKNIGLKTQLHKDLLNCNLSCLLYRYDGYIISNGNIVKQGLQKLGACDKVGIHVLNQENGKMLVQFSINGKLQHEPVEFTPDDPVHLYGDIGKGKMTIL